MSVAGDSAYYAGSLVEQIIAAEAITHIPTNNVCLPLVTVVSAASGDTITIPVWNQGTNTVTSASYTNTAEGTVCPAVKLNSDKKTGTMDMWSIYLPLYDESRDSSLEDINVRLGAIAAGAAGANFDDQITDLFDAFTGNAVANSTSAGSFTVDNLFAAIALLKADGAPGFYNFVGNPKQIWGAYGIMNDLVTSTQFGGSPALQAEGLANGMVSKIAGVGIFSSPEVEETSSACKGAVFSKEALAFGYVGPMIRVELQREALYLRNNLVVSSFNDAWELVDNYGCEIHTRTSA